ncbi:MAG: hypothetical protein LUH15_10950 [Tannerellaceae bacterium]|nr:hypothetical protein [Tannerellaceae bacterium]
MKNAVKYLFTFILAALIFYGGAGINLVSYCCGDCRSAGVEVVLNEKCCEIHDHDHQPTHQHHTDCSHTHHSPDVNHTRSGIAIQEENCCDLQRLDFEWDNSITHIQQPAPVELDLSVMGLPSLTLLTVLVDKDAEAEPDQYIPPLIVCPVYTYLSLLHF